MDKTMIEQLVASWNEDWSHAVSYFMAQTGLTFDQSLQYLLTQALIGGAFRSPKPTAESESERARAKRILDLVERELKDRHKDENWKGE